MKCTEYNELTLVSDVYVGVSRADGVRNDNCPPSLPVEGDGIRICFPAASFNCEEGSSSQLSFLTPSARETPT